MSESMLPRSTPEVQGVNPKGILDFVNGMEEKNLGPHSFMLLRHGKVIAEGWWNPYRRDDVHLLYSLSKSFTSTAIGFAVAERLLSLEDKVISFFPEVAPADPSENVAAMRVFDLLTMNTGHEVEPDRGALTGAPDKNWPHAFLAHPVPHKPGSRFLYNSAATYMCSAILNRLTGQSLLEYLQPRLLGPLGVEIATWETCPAGIQVGGWGLSVTTETIAKFGQLYLQKGVWEGKQLLPIGWVEMASAAQVSNADGQDPHEWNQGYGFQFWRSRNNCYRGDGAFGQNVVVMDDFDAVLVTTASNPDLGATHQLLWDHILPAMDAAPTASQELAAKLATLDVGIEGSDVIPTILNGRFYCEGLRIDIDSRPDGVTLTWDAGEGEQTIEAPTGRWQDGEAMLDGWQHLKIAARATWSHGLVVRGVATQTPFQATIMFKPVDDGYELEWNRFGDFGSTEGPRGLLKAAEPAAN